MLGDQVVVWLFLPVQAGLDCMPIWRAQVLSEIALHPPIRKPRLWGVEKVAWIPRKLKKTVEIDTANAGGM